MTKLATRSPNGRRAPEYVGWRAELLAQLALSRLKGVAVHKSDADHGYDFLVATDDGACLFVGIRGFSSLDAGLSDVADRPVLEHRVDRTFAARAARSRSPFVLFLFDADTEHGRFLRIDGSRVPTAGRGSITLRFPVGNTISKESLDRLVAELVPSRRSA